MAGPGRRELLCEQDPFELTGIDFVSVDPADHRILSVFFVVEPDQLARPVDTSATEFTATIVGREDGSVLAVATHAWTTIPDASGAPRLALMATAEAEATSRPTA